MPSSKSCITRAKIILIFALAVMLPMIADMAEAARDIDEALSDAAHIGNLQYVTDLLNQGADVNAKLDGGLTPLLSATLGGQVAAAELLIQRGADVNAKDSNGVSALILASQIGPRSLSD